MIFTGLGQADQHACIIKLPVMVDNSTLQSLSFDCGEKIYGFIPADKP